MHTRLRRVSVCVGAGLFLSACGEEPNQYVVRETRTSLDSAWLPPLQLEGWSRAVWMDFGRRDMRAEGAVAVSTTFRFDEAAWTRGMVRNRYLEEQVHPFYRTWIEGEDATLEIGWSPGRRRILLTLGNPVDARGPMTIRLDGRVLGSGIRTAPGEYVHLDESWESTSDRIELEFLGEECSAFSVTGLAIYRAQDESAPSGLRAIFKPDPAPVPVPDTADRPLPNALQEQWEGIRDYFLLASATDGMFSQSGAWYQNAFPIRAFLSYPEEMERPAVRAAVFSCLDRFVDAQRADGSWASNYFGRPGCELATPVAANTFTANLADIGAMAVCLPLAAREADPTRRARYLHAATQYAERIVLPSQLPSGAFPNLKYEGTLYEGPYSVATASQALFLLVLGQVVDHPQIADAGSRALAELAASVSDDGSIRFYHHDRVDPTAMTASEMGDLFYIYDALVEGLSRCRPEQRVPVMAALDRSMQGPLGLLACINQPAWWEPALPWEQAKRIGVIHLTQRYRWVMGTQGVATPGELRLAVAVANRPYATWFGVLVPQYAPGGDHAITATGLAGLGLASLRPPGELSLKTR